MLNIKIIVDKCWNATEQDYDINWFITYCCVSHLSHVLLMFRPRLTRIWFALFISNRSCKISKRDIYKRIHKLFLHVAKASTRADGR